jgi:hypothetical protein
MIYSQLNEHPLSDSSPMLIDFLVPWVPNQIFPVMVLFESRDEASLDWIEY